MLQFINVRLGITLQLTALLDIARDHLANMAVHLEQANLDEQSRRSDRRFSTDIRLLQERGLYNALCNLQLKHMKEKAPWKGNVQVSVLFYRY